MASTAIAMPPAPTEFLWSRKDYEELISKGAFGSDERIELLDGKLISMAPQFSPHTTSCQLCTDYLRRAFASGYVVRAQFPLALDDRSEPEPDLAVVRGEPRDFSDAHPTSAELLVEVSDSSLSYDRGEKLAAYARAGIPEYWIVNIVDRVVEVYREPAGEKYGSLQTFENEASFAPLGQGDDPISARELLP